MKKALFLIVLLSLNSNADNSINDPFEEINRATFEFNESLDEYVAKPVAEVYSNFPKKKFWKSNDNQNWVRF